MWNLCAPLVAGVALVLSTQRVVELKPGLGEYKEVVKAALPSLRKDGSIKVGPSLDVVRRFGDWALVYDRINLKTTDGRQLEWVCLLRKTGGNWRKARAMVGGSALVLLKKEQPNLPTGFFKEPPIRLQ